jgi:hypothetical protein
MFVVAKQYNGSEEFEYCGFSFSPNWKVLTGQDKLPDIKSDQILVVLVLEDFSFGF